MTTLVRNENTTQAPRLGYVMQINILMKALGVETKYKMSQILGIPFPSDFYRYFRSGDNGYTPASKYLWRMLHLACLVAEGKWDIETFDPTTYWAKLDHALLTYGKDADA